MFTPHKASRLRDIACLAFVISMLMTACGGGSGSSSDPSTSSSSASSASSLASSETSSSASSTAALPLLTSVTGWASKGDGTTGGAGAAASNIYVVHDRAELNAALANKNSPTYATDTAAAAKEAKIIYVVGSIYGTDLGNGKFADEAYYKTLNAKAAQWDWNLYIKSVTPGFIAADATEATAVSNLSAAHTTLNTLQKTQIQFTIPSNTTIMGVGADARIIDGYFNINATSNIIVRNIEFQAPIDLAPYYSNTSGSEEWNAKFKAISIVTGKQLWFDHCTFTDGSHLDTEILTIGSKTLPVMRHDGLLDIEDGSDYITVSYSLFKNHDKTNMVGGSGDGNGQKERAYNHITFSHNIWEDSVQRAPRARFGKIHVYNNSYSGNTDDAIYPASYYIGMGAESKILSEANAFDMTGSKATVSRVMSNLNGYQFKDNGSWFNGVAASAALEAAAKAALDARWSSARKAADGTATPTTAQVNSVFTLDAYTNELGWTPEYSYTLASSAAELRAHNSANAGAGKLPVTASSSIRPMLDDAAAASRTLAAALAGTDAWAPQDVNAGQPNAGRLYAAGFSADYVVAKDGSGTHTSIQAALNAASTSTAARVYIRVKAGDYNEQVIVGNTTAAITLYSLEADATKVRLYNALAKGSPQSSYTALVGTPYDSSVYAGNADAKTVYNLCMASGKVSAIGTECSATMRVRNNGFQLVNITVENAWAETGSNDQANAVMIDKADKIVLDGVRLLGNQDTLYLANSGKRVYVTASEIAGDVDFIYGAGIGVFDGSTIRSIGTRKASGTSIASPSTTAATQTVGLLFNRSVFLADSSTTADSIYLARQWDDSSTDAPGKMLVRNSFIGRHVALTSGPWSPTVIGGSATQYAYLNEYRNWDEVQRSSGSSSSSASSASSSVSSSSSSASSSSSSVAIGTGSDTAISGSSTLTNAYVSTGLPVTVGTSYDSTNGIYSMVSAGSLGTNTVLTDTMQFAYKAITGDFTMMARLTSLEVPSGLSTSNVRAGLLLRANKSDASRFYGIMVRGIPRIQWEQRLADGGATASSSLLSLSALPSASAPVWLKLQRSGQIISVSYSTDLGLTWSTPKTQDFSSASGAVRLDDTAYVGLAGVSGSTTVTSTASFDNVTITQGSSSSSSSSSSASSSASSI